MKSGGKGKFKEIRNHFVFIFAAALLTILFTQDFLFTFAPLKELELKLIDNRFSARGKIEIADSADVVIVEIDQESLNQLPPPYNKAPLQRFIYGKVIDNLNEAGAAAIGIDVIMSSADYNNPASDSLFRTSILKWHNVVLAGKIDEAKELMIEESSYAVTDTSYKKHFYNFENVFFEVDSSLGIVQSQSDYDFIFRRYLPFRYTAITGNRIPSFGFAILNKVNGLSNFTTAESDEEYFKLGGKKIPKYDNTSVMINFYGPSRTFKYVKLIDLLDDSTFRTKDEIELEEEINVWDELKNDAAYQKLFKDKIVLIGSTMPEDRDLIPISFAKGEHKGDNLIYGVEYHANIIQNILDGDYLYKQSKESEIIFVLIISMIIFYAGSLIRKIKIRMNVLVELINLIFAAALVYGIYLVSIQLFINNKIVTAVVGPSFAVVFGYITATAYHFIKERQQNVMIKGMFSQYVSRAVVNELITNPDKLKLGGEKKSLTILFSDIAGFTTFAEKKKPEELVSFINEFLNEMSDIIIANEGTLDKYLGDAVMAFWGAPIKVDDHAYKACATALQMQEKLASMREKWLTKGEQPVHIRIGINSGEVIVGNIGGAKRFDYTVLGDDVNLASRLEGANKEYGSNIMISDSTYQIVKDKVLVRELDVIRVKGKTEPTKVYELISLTGDQKAITAIEEMHEYFQGLELYRLKSFEAAHDYFKRCFEKFNDRPSNVYMHRCEYYLANPPAKEWDGVFELKTK